MGVDVHLTLHEGRVRVTPAGRLEESRFDDFRDGCRKAGAMYDRAMKTHMGKLSQVHDICSNLRASGLNPIVSPRLFERLELEGPAKNIEDAEDWLVYIMGELEKRNLKLREFQEIGVRELRRRKSFMLLDQQGLGKGQPLDAKVLTRSGFIEMREVKVGTKILCPDNTESEVVAVYPQGDQDVYRITFSDGTSTECDGSHLWSVSSYSNRNSYKVLSTREILDNGYLRNRSGRSIDSRYFIDLPNELGFCGGKTYTDAYILGVLIGDGSISSGRQIRFTSADSEIVENVRISLTDENRLTKYGDMEYGICGKGRAGMAGSNPILSEVKRLGLNVRSHEKHIPNNCLFSSISYRKRLLSGLLDTDGWVSAGVAHFGTTSKRLSEDVAFLARSLGAKCTIQVSKKNTSNVSVEGKTVRKCKNPRVFYTVRICSDFNPFLLSRKYNKWLPHKNPKRIGIRNIEFIGRKPTQCIKIDHPDELYITNDFIVTHNTVQLLCSVDEGAPVLVVCTGAMKGTWKKECEIWRPDLKPIIINGRNRFRYPKKGECIIINYDILPKGEILPENEDWNIKKTKSYVLFKECSDLDLKWTEKQDDGKEKTFAPKVKLPLDMYPENGTYLLIDEVQNAMNSGSLRHKALRAITRSVKNKDGYTYAGTGTPMHNNPMELCNVLKVLDLFKEAFGSWGNFIALFGGVRQQTNFGGGRQIWNWNVPRKPETEAEKRRLDQIVSSIRKVSLRREMDKVGIEVPPIVIQDIVVDIDAKTKKQCDKAKKDLEKSGISLDDAIDKMIELGDDAPGFTELARAYKQLAIAKIPGAMQIVEDLEHNGEAPLVFSAHRAPIDIFDAREGWATITGSTNNDVRTRIVDDFQDGKLAGIGCTIKAGGVGLTLTKAAYAIFVDLHWSPANNEQAIFRIRRIGQTRNQVVYRIIANHELDRRKAEKLDIKEAMIEHYVSATTITGRPEERVGNEVIGVEVEVAEPKIKAPSVRRAASSPQERWASQGLRKLSSLDPDGAAIANASGFNKIDSVRGKSLTSRLGIGLVQKEWDFAIKMLKKYHRQVGVCPGDPGSEDEKG